MKFTTIITSVFCGQTRTLFATDFFCLNAPKPAAALQKRATLGQCALSAPRLYGLHLSVGDPGHANGGIPRTPV